MKTRHKIIPAVYLLLCRENEILLLRRFNTGYKDGDFSMVAGHLEGDEPMKDAIKREALEEVGIFIETKELQLVHVMHTKSEIKGNSSDERVDFYFKTNQFLGVIQNKEPDKCDMIEWYAWDNLPNNIVPRVKNALIAIKNGSVYSEYGW